jgi:hypothetical protein
VDRDWIALLRGQVAFHRGDYMQAKELIEPLSSSAAPTVSSVSLLATAQLAAGSWEAYETLLDRAESLTPQTAEDFLFRGQAEVYFDPRQATASLSQALRLRDTPLARLVRAEARSNLAFDTSDEAFLRVLLLSEVGNLAVARTAYEELAQRYQTGLTAYFCPSLLLLFGDADVAQSVSRKLQSATKQPRFRRAFYARLLAFNGGEIAESELLAAAKSSRWDQCESLFFAGLQRLAHGDRDAARELFERCVATRCAGFLSWDWSHAFLKRWESDPHWPPWIP